MPPTTMGLLCISESLKASWVSKVQATWSLATLAGLICGKGRVADVIRSAVDGPADIGRFERDGETQKEPTHVFAF